MKKRVKLSVLLLVTALVCVFSFTCAAAQQVGTDTLIKVDENIECFTFIPETTGLYSMNSVSDSDPWIEVYDSEDNYIGSADDTDDGLDFILDVNLIKDEVYSVTIGNYESDFGEVLFKIEFICAHGNVTDYPAVDATCTENGYTAGKKCDDCEYWIIEREEIEGGHKEENGDRVCDVCGGESTERVSELNDEGTAFGKHFINGDYVICGNGIADYEYDSSQNVGEISKVYIGKDISELVSVPMSDTIEEYIVEQGSAYFKTDAAGVLYSLDGKELIAYPGKAERTSYDILEGTETVRDYVFYASEYLEEISVPSSIKYFPVNCLNDTIYESASWEDGVLYLGDMVIDIDFTSPDGRIPFEVSLSFKEGTRVICSGALDLNMSVYQSPRVYITLPDSVEVVCDFAVDEQMKLVQIELSESLRYIGKGNLVSEVLRSITISDKNEYYTTDEQGALLNKSKTKLIAFPAAVIGGYVMASSVTEMESFAFRNTELSYIKLSDKITEIPEGAFFYANILDVEIPASVKKIGRNAFFGINGDAIVFPETVEYVSSTAFCNDNGIIFFMNPECVIEQNVSDVRIIIAGYTGSTADLYAQKYGYSFLSLDEDHSHVYIPRTLKAVTCTEGGEEFYYCPCGESETYLLKTEAWGHEINEMTIDGRTGKGECYYCGAEMNVYEDCDCRCHEVNRKNIFDKIIYKFQLIIWKLFRIKDYCDCGYSIHYMEVDK